MTQVVSLFGMNLPVQRGHARRRPSISGGHGARRRDGRRRSVERGPQTPAQVRCAHDAQGRLTSRCDGEGRETRYAYGQARLPVQVNYPDGSSRHFAYDERERLVSETDPAGRTTNYRYDARGMPAQIDYADGRRATWRYDAEGRLVKVTDSACAIRYTHDSAGRVIRQEREVEGRIFVTQYTYDDRGRCVGQRPPGSERWLRYEYDDQGRLTGIQADDGQPFLQHTYEGGRRVRTTFGNGVTTEHKLGGVGGLRRVQTRAPDRDMLLLDLPLAYDRLGNVVGAGEQRFEYDGLGQLTTAHDAAQATRYAYDRAGNRLAQESSSGQAGCAEQDTPPDGHARTRYRYDVLGRLTAEIRPDGTERRYAHDRCGNLIRQQELIGTIDYTYDAAGRLVEIARDEQVIARYTYDARGHRLRIKADGQAIVEHRDPLGQLLAETTPEGRVLATYVRAGGRMVARIPGPVGSEGITYYHLDHLGSPRAITDDQGQVLWRGGYGPFGEARFVDGYEPRYGFAGYEWEPGAGLYYAGARWYDPKLGRFLTLDSYTHGPDDPRQLWGWVDDSTPAAWSRDPRRLNRYAYCLNNPATYVDLDGHSALGVFLTIIGFIWASPATVFGCALWLCLEILNLIALILSLAGVFQGIGVSGHSSGTLSTFALFFEGGMIGSFMNALSSSTAKFGGFTSGYTVFIQESEAGNTKAICHELRHTNQYGWFGPFFALPILIAPFITLPVLGLDLIFDFLKDREVKLFLLGETAAPLFTVYFWDLLVHGFNYGNTWAEKDAFAHETC